MESSLRNPYGGKFVVESLLWIMLLLNLCCGIFVVESSLRDICCWCVVVESSLSSSCCGIFVLVSFVV